METNASGSLSTGAMLGNTGGTYDRNTDTITFSLLANTTYANVNFGDVAANTLSTDGQQAGLPGTIILLRDGGYSDEEILRWLFAEE